MKRATIVLVIAVGVLLVSASSVQAQHHRHWGGHAGISVGWRPWWAPWWGPGWYGPGLRAGIINSDLTVVDTDVSPEEALVYLDDRLIGTADDFDGYPDYLYLEPGTYKLELRLRGYQSETVEVRAKRGGHFPLDLELKRIPGEKPASWWDRPANLPVGRVFGPPVGGEPKEPRGADTTLRPETRGTAPSASEEAESEEPENEAPEVEETPAPGEGERAPTLAQGKPSPRATAALELRVSPGNAAVYVDGELVGTGEELSRLERGLAVTPGSHKIEVFAPGKAAKVIEVGVKSGERQQVVVELESGT
jgi:hypothetical protein